MSHKQPPPPKFNLLAPSLQRPPGSSAPSRPLGQRDDLGLQRYVLTKPDDILPLPNGKLANGMFYCLLFFFFLTHHG